MPPLRSLEQDFPIIDSNFRRFCASHGVFSVEDFLVNDICALTGFAEREPMSEALKKGIAQVVSIMDRQHQPWLNGIDLLRDARENKRVLPTGCQGIDFVLQGGLREGLLVELAGPSSSGKTQVCLHAAAQVVHEQLGTVMFLDTGNSFSAERISSFLDRSSVSSSLSKVNKERRCCSIMNSIVCQPVFEIFELLDMLHQLGITLRHQVRSEGKKLCLLIVDSISSLITPILGGKDSHGRSLMISTGFALKRLANEHNLSILVTNHMVGGDGGTLKPALGESWKSIPHTRLLLSRDCGTNMCTVSVLKHSSMARQVMTTLAETFNRHLAEPTSDQYSIFYTASGVSATFMINDRRSRSSEGNLLPHT